ncbi:MAG TPA: tol-pal system protein YbgF [Moraxellaceae bacterium]|nr:tol-pal system protein YbgF [Moraxellaceae bacterium]
MTRFRLATLTPLLLAAAVARADIPVEDRPLTAPEPRATAPAPTTPAPATPASSGIPSGSPSGAPSGTPSGSHAPSAVTAPAAAPSDQDSAWQQYTQVDQLQQQVEKLQGLVEQQGFLIEKLQNDLRARYTDLDHRLNAQQELIQQQQSASPSATTPQPTGPAAAATSDDEKKAYLAAYDTFRSGGPDKAIPPMLAFVKRYPNSTFASSAHYWLGEFYLNATTPDQDAAQKQFDIVLTTYPDSQKAPAALYKTAAILDLRGKPQEARKRMKELLQKFPKSPEATLAQNYIDAQDAASQPPAKPTDAKESKAGAKPQKKAAPTTSRKKN